MTVAKIIGTKANRPTLKLWYIRGFIRGCGGSEDEQRCWVAAWRRIDRAHRGLPPEPGSRLGDGELYGDPR